MDVSVEQSWVPRFERHELDTPASWWRWEQEVAPGKAEHAMAYMRAWNPFDRKFQGDIGATVPETGDGSAFLAPNSTDTSANPSPDPEQRYETISDGPVKNGWRVNLIGWIKDHRP